MPPDNLKCQRKTFYWFWKWKFNGFYSWTYKSNKRFKQQEMHSNEFRIEDERVRESRKESKLKPPYPKRLHNLLFISILNKQKQINLLELDLIANFTWILLLIFCCCIYVFCPTQIPIFLFGIGCYFAEIAWNQTQSIGMHCYCHCENSPNGLYERIRNFHNCDRAHCAAMQPVYKNNW